MMEEERRKGVKERKEGEMAGIVMEGVNGVGEGGE